MSGFPDRKFSGAAAPCGGVFGQGRDGLATGLAAIRWSQTKPPRGGFTTAETLIALGLLAIGLLVFSALSRSTSEQSAAASRATGLWLAFRTVQSRLGDPESVPFSAARGNAELAAFYFTSDGSEVSRDHPAAVWTVSLRPAPSPGWSSQGLQTLAARATEITSGRLHESLLMQRRVP